MILQEMQKIMVDVDNKELTKTNSKFIDVFIQCDALEFIKKLSIYMKKINKRNTDG